MEIHYLVVVVIIFVIIVFQIRIYQNTKSKIEWFKSIFPDSISAFSIAELSVNLNRLEEESIEIEEEGEYEDENSCVVVSQIRTTVRNKTLSEIITALNMYLQKNKGAASDFHLMKDVVERYCDAEEEEINIQQPIPLYLGLMGTMVGIIVGIGFIAVSGGLSSESLMENITSLMTCVAIAMGASLVGIFCTTKISWASKNATSKVEADKNAFYSWLQTELLPVLSGNAVNALYLLQQNLMTFNQSFQSNIEGLNGALSKVSDSSREQVELIELIKDIDVKRVAQANIVVLKELKECMGEISVFNKYLQSVSTYLNAVNGLNDNINEHLNRTAAIERMGAFFEREINQVAVREQYINEVVAKVDDTLRKTFEQILESTQEGVSQLRNNSVSEFDALLKHYAEQKEEFAKMLQEQKESWASKNDEFSALMGEIRHLSGLKESLNELTQASKGQTILLERMLQTLEQQHKGVRADQVSAPATPLVSTVPVIEMPKFPKSIVYMVATMTLLATLSFGLYIYNSFIDNPKKEEVVRVPVEAEKTIHKAMSDTLKVNPANEKDSVVQQN